MRFHILAAFMLVALVSYVHCGCDKKSSEEDSEESGVGHFFKNLGCDIKKGADKVSEATKPWVDEVSKSAKKFGGTVSDTFSDLKEKITGNSDNSTAKPSTESTSADSSSSLPTPSSIDDRLLLDADQKCPDGKVNDGRGHCRSIA